MRDLLRKLLDEEIPGGTGWWFTLGSVLLSALALQTITGILLALTYAPTPDHAHDSVRYIEQSVRAGTLLRGLHHYGASLIVIAALLHIVRVVVFGAYRKPRHLTWLTGLALFLVILAFALTGYLLPWDQRAYWATVVTINISALAPVAGDTVASILRGGDDIGALTLTRWYAAHVIVLPALLAVLAGVHLYLIRRHGISGPFVTRGASFPFFPFQAARDVVVSLGAIVVLVVIAWSGAPPLEPVADPSDATYVPRPEWYFLGLFQLLKYFPGRLEVVGAIVLPTIVILLLALLPWLDRGTSREPRRRLATLVPFGAGLIAIVSLTAAGWRDAPPARDGRWTVREIGGAAMAARPACTRCHAEGAVADRLQAGRISRDTSWIEGHLLDPEMIAPGLREPPETEERETQAMLAYVARLRRGDAPPALPEQDVIAMRVFARFCIGCHRVGDDARDGGTDGPDLSGIGRKHAPGALRLWISNPEAVKPGSEMPAFGSRLSGEEMTALISWLVSKR